MKIRPLCVAFACIAGICMILFGQRSPAPAQGTTGIAGHEVCSGCHEEVVKRLERTPHGRLFLKQPRNALEQIGCETCHGPGEEHANSGGAEFGGLVKFTRGTTATVETRNDACLKCHNRKKQLFWSGSPHQMRDLACTKCHSGHKGGETSARRYQLSGESVSAVCGECHKQQLNQQMRFSHHPLREDKMTCASCHNPHGTPTEKLLKANSLNDLCYTCHMEKRGPFLFEHSPVTEECSNCHLPHGSTNERLLKVPVFRLCRQCHINFHTVNAANVSPGIVKGRLCTNCHFNIHGSNHPTRQGNFFLR